MKTSSFYLERFEEYVDLVNECARERIFSNCIVDCDKCPVYQECVDFWDEYVTTPPRRDPDFYKNCFARLRELRMLKHLSIVDESVI